jgi:hypothetical protein
MQLNRKGVAGVNSPNGSGGQFGGIMFLFSGGFFLSGQYNGEVWANAVASASLVEDYLPGMVDGENDPNAVLYRVGSSDIPFGQSWQDWSDAVGLGADFYDGNGDDIYTPSDFNSNGQWDPNEDCPDILGDEMPGVFFMMDYQLHKEDGIQHWKLELKSAKQYSLIQAYRN